VERWGNLRFFSLIDLLLDNPSDNADMSNEKGDVYQDNLLNYI
jgi:hypothetical protein